MKPEDTHLVSGLPDGTQAQQHDCGECAIRHTSKDEPVTTPHRNPSRLAVQLIAEELDRPKYYVDGGECPDQPGDCAMQYGQFVRPKMSEGTKGQECYRWRF